MSDQKIILRMTSTQVQEDGQEISAKLTATGTLQRDAEGAVIRYEENAEGLNGQVTMELRGDTVLLVREGDAQMRLVLKQGSKYVNYYKTTYGTLDMEVMPTRVSYTLGETNGKVDLEYHVTVSDQYVGLNRIQLAFRTRA